MLSKEELEELLEQSLTTGATYAEIFYQSEQEKNYILENSQLDKVGHSIDCGIGVRLMNDDYQVYGYTMKIDKESVSQVIQQLLPSFSEKKENCKICLQEQTKKPVSEVILSHQNYPFEQKLSLLKKIDSYAREVSPKIYQVSAMLVEVDTETMIANSDGIMTKEHRSLTRLVVHPYAKEGDHIEDILQSVGIGAGYEFLEKINLSKFVEDLASAVVKKLDSVDCPSGEFPIILSPGFGGVIFHEACGHALEATSVAYQNSPFWNQMGKKIASSKVTLIDDGTIPNEWGSATYDDEGTPTQKNILIENGILKGFLVDRFHEKKMNFPRTGSGRRQDYTYMPTSRMNNTYLAKGTDKIDDMFQSISFGIYCKNLSGGTVDPATGDFNFSTSEAYLIENGKVTKPIKKISLMGNNQEILQNVEMVSDDLELGTGYCGSSSGTVYVTVGQPTIKVSKILVGGTKS